MLVHRSTTFAAIVLALAASILLISGTPAQAALNAYCITTSTGQVYVGLKVKIPLKGKCVAWSGFCSTGCSPDNVQTGTACTASDDSHVSFEINTAYLASNRQWDWVRVDLPANTGSGNFNDLASGIGGTVSYTATGAKCTAPAVP
jgi:hypothetical protein